MSSSRRRARSPGSPATGRPAAAVDSAPEAVAAEVHEKPTPEDTAPGDTAPLEIAEAVTEVVEAGTETAAIPEVPAETSPETVHAAVDESVTEAVGQATDQATDTVAALQDETAAAVAEATETATEQVVEAVDGAAEPVAEAVEAAQPPAAETVDQIAETAMTLAAAPLAAAEAVTKTTAAPFGEAKPFAGTAGVRLTFIPTFEPLNEINATLLAFARGEGEAAMAHLQALTKVKTPAEAIRLQVSEFQRAADASLTCFSHILRSANRLGGPARWN